MTGKCYYMTTLGAWQRYAPRFANSHFVVLAPQAALQPASESDDPARAAAIVDAAADSGDQTPILVLVEADEGVHLSLEDEPAFEPLPHPLAQKAISDAAQSALAPHGVARGATTFDAAEALARVHPLLRHRVF